MNFYARHIGDYLKDTAHLSLLHHGIYARLMDVYYTREQGFTEGEAHRLIGARTKDERAATDEVLSEFFALKDGAWIQGRCDEEIAAYQHKQELARRSAEARWAKSERNANAFSSGDAKQMRSHSDGNAPNPNPNPISQGKEKKPRAVALDCPEGVSPQTWADWLALRKAKRAPVTETVIADAESEAAKAGMSLNAFLVKWCGRGSQGLEAGWLTSSKPANRQLAIEAENRRVATAFLEGTQT